MCPCCCCFQPLDLCSPDRTLLMAEEMILHQADLLPAKVTALQVYCKYTATNSTTKVTTSTDIICKLELKQLIN